MIEILGWIALPFVVLWSLFGALWLTIMIIDYLNPSKSLKWAWTALVFRGKAQERCLAIWNELRKKEMKKYPPPRPKPHPDNTVDLSKPKSKQ